MPDYVDASSVLSQQGTRIHLLSQETEFKEEDYLKDLAVLSIVNFCETYQSYRGGLANPRMIQKCMTKKVKVLLVSSPTGTKWNTASVSNFDTWNSDNVILFLKDYTTPTSKSDFFKKLKACTEFPHMSKKYIISSRNFKYFNEKYRLFVTKFRYTYYFLTELIEKRCELPYITRGGGKTQSLKSLFLDRMPYRMGSKLLKDQDEEMLMGIKTIDDLMICTDHIVLGAYERHLERRQDDNWMMDEADYEAEYGDWEYTGKSKKLYNDKSNERSKPAASPIYDTDNDSHQSTPVHENRNLSNDSDTEAPPPAKGVSFQLSAFDGNKPPTKPLFPGKKSPFVNKDSSRPNSGATNNPDMPRVCFGDFWMGKCSKVKCDYCGTNAEKNGRKYWEYVVPLICNHRYKPRGHTVLWTKGILAQKPANEPVSRKFDSIEQDYEQATLPGDTHDESSEEQSVGT